MTATGAQASTHIPKEVFLAAVALYAIANGIFLVRSIQGGSWPLAVIAAWLASPVPIALLSQFWENGRVEENRSVGYLVANYRDQSYAFFFGDTISLPFTAAMAAIAWRYVPEGSWWRSWQWIAISAIVGATAGFVFRHVNDKDNYLKKGAAGSFNAPSKLLHDWGAYPMLFGALFCALVALAVLIVTGRALHIVIVLEVVALMGIGAWLVMGITHDQHLVPQNLHPNDWRWSALTGVA